MKRRLLLITLTATLAVCSVAIATAVTTNIHLRKTSYGSSIQALRLQDGHHRPIYVFTKDGRDKSRCFAACARMFAPVIARGKVKAFNGVRQKLLGVINRGHGVKQVTYNHHPLYTDPNDSAGAAADDGCQYFGGRWYVVGRNGNPDKRFNTVCGVY